MKKTILIGIGLLLLAHLPFFILEENSFVLIHDNLDGDFTYLHVLKISNKLLSFNDSSQVLNIFNGISRDYFHSEYSFIRILFYFLPSFWAYVFNSIIVRIIGFAGICFLIKDYFNYEKPSYFLIFIIAFSFSLLPIYTIYGLSCMGQPILLWTFLNLKNKCRIFSSSLIIFVFPFYTNFALVAPFVLIALFIYGLICIRNSKKRISIYYWIGIGVLFILFLLANHSIIGGFLFDEVKSHRESFSFNTPTLLKTIKTFILTLLNGQYHSSTFNSLPIIILILFAVWKKTENFNKSINVFISILLICAFHSIYRFISVPLEENFHLLTSFQFNRFTFLLPFLFFLIIILNYQDKLINRKFFLATLLIFSLLSTYKNKEFTVNFAKILLPENYTSDITTFKVFFSKNLFQTINKHINIPQEKYRIVSLGFYPAITQYNGFYTLDSYQNNYPLHYKNSFREVISSELDKNNDLKKYFDNWGNRCYLFSAELKESCYMECGKYSGIEVQNLEINIEKLKQMGATYIFSAVPISNYRQLGLSYDRSFEDNISKLIIYLYKL